MARQPRVHFPGAIYHAMARGVDGRDIFIDDFDRIAFLASMRRIERETSARVIAYCLMGNHFHLAIQVSLVTLSAVMQRLQTSYCMRFNGRHDRTGHLFQARHKAIVCADDRYLTGLIRYIHMNPVRAKLVASPGDWPWSSYVPGEIVGSEITDFDPWPKDRRDEDMARVKAGPVDLEFVGSDIVARTGVSLELLRSEQRGESILAARRLFVKDAVRGGRTIVSAAKWLNISSRSASRYIQENNVMVSGLTPI
ncbi:MAG: transposase [Elusimicrobiota bacterium]|jgi:REP element-mobilizing transposase RayT